MVHTASIPTNIAYHVCVVSRCFRLYKVQDVLVYMPPTITYIYGLKKQLFVLISSTTTKFVNVAPGGTTRTSTVKYLLFARILAHFIDSSPSKTQYNNFQDNFPDLGDFNKNSRKETISTIFAKREYR